MGRLFLGGFAVKAIFWLFLAGNAYGGDKFFAVNLGLTFSQESQESENGDRSTDVNKINAHAGFFPLGGFIVGLKYYSETTANSSTSIVNQTTSSTTTTTATTTGMGLHVGFYADNGFTFGLSYLIAPTYERTGLQYFGGSGMIAEAGWCWEWGDFGFGAQLVYSSLSFAKYKVNGVEADFTEDEKWVEMEPMGFAALFF